MNTVDDALRDVMGSWRLVILGAALLIAAFLLIPVGVIVSISFTESHFLSFPPDGFSFQWYREIVDSTRWREASWSSVQLTLGGAALATVTGTLAALSVRRMRGRGHWARVVFIAPLIIPQIVFALGLYLVFDEMRAIGSSWAVMAGQGIIAFPFVFVAVSAGLAAVDPALPRAGSSLGARWPQIVSQIELPVIWRSVAAGALFALATCFDEVVVALYVTSPEKPTLPVTLWNLAHENVTPDVAAMSTIVMVLAVVFLGLGTWLLARSRVAGESAP